MYIFTSLKGLFKKENFKFPLFIPLSDLTFGMYFLSCNFKVVAKFMVR